MLKGKLKIISAFIAIAFLSVAIMLIGLYDFSLARAAETTETAAVTGVQVRSWGIGNGYDFIVLQNGAYSEIKADTTVSGAENYNTRSKVKIYTSETDTAGKYLTEICGIWWTQNLWGSGGLMLAVDDYNTYNGTTVYKITVEAGCQLPCGDTVYETAETVSYINNDFGKAASKNGAYNWTRVADEIGTASLNGVQVRSAGKAAGSENYGSENFIVLLSDAYNAAPSSKADIASFNTREKIKVYTSAEDKTGKSCFELLGGWYEYSYWGQNGLFMAFNKPADYQNTYNGKTIYKIVIEKGCQLPYGQYGYYVTSEEYTFYNLQYDNEEVVNGAFEWSETKPQPQPPKTETKISLTGVQMRGAINGWYYYLVLQSAAYGGKTSTEGIDGATDITAYGYDKIRLYTSADDTTGKPLSELTLQHIGCNQWGENGLFINFAEYNTTYGGHQVYKITIEAGCILPSGDGNFFIVDKDYSYLNGDYGNFDKKLEAVNWVKYLLVREQTVSLSGVQMRGIENSWYHYLVLQSEAFNGMGSTDGNFANEYTRTYSSFDKIRLYTSEEDTEGKALSELTIQHVERNFGSWTDGLFINYTEYDNGGYGGHQLYKIAIEKGCKLLAKTAAESATVFVTDEEYVYYNQSYGYEKDKLGAYEWTENAPFEKAYVKASVSGVQMRGWSDNGWYQFLVIRSEAFEKAEKAETVAFWKTCITEDKIVFYTKDEEGNLIPKKLSELTVQHVGASFWDTGSYINYAEYAEELNGQNVYKVEILKGCKIPIGESDGKLLVMRVDDDYTFFNNSCGSAEKKFENFDWSVYEIPQVVENTGTIKIETVTNQCGDNRYVIIRLGDAFSTAMSAKFFADKNLCNTLDKILIYSGNDLSAEPVTLRSIWTGEINLRQYGSPSDIGFSILNEERLNGTNMYAVKILKDCELPFVNGGEFSKKTVDREYTFVNSHYGKSGDIPGSYDEQYQTPRKYENFAVEWQKAAIIEYKVIGIEGLSFKKECLAVNSAIDFSAFAKEGYDLSATDDLGYTYYGKIIVPVEDTVITLKYTAAEKKDDDKPAENSSCKGTVIGGEAWLIAVAIAVIFAANKKKSIKR